MAVLISAIYIGKGLVPIKYVRIEGVFQYLSKEEIQVVLEPLVSVSFFDVDMQGIQQTLSQMTWVQSVAVNRVWPDALAIKIYEKRPFVRWGKDSLISTRGELIEPKVIETFENLPLLEGPTMQHVKSLEIMKGVKTALEDQAMEMTEFTINDRWAWKIKLTTGMEILLGRNEQLKKLRRFLKTIEVLGQDKINAIAVVDLRYPNGYAVTWKPDAPSIDWQSIQYKTQ